MFAYAVRRILHFIPTILVISLLMFLLLNVLPGNAALMAGGRQQLEPELIEKLKKEWGLDKPLHVRYLTYLTDLVQGDLGISYLRRENVSGLIAARLWPTLKLAVVSLLIAVVVGVPLGFFSALRQGTWLDTFSMVWAVSGVSVPQFWLGLLLMLFFSIKLSLFPTYGYGDGEWQHLVLPALTLGVGYMALLARTTRAAVVEVLTADYITTAHAKGISDLLINGKHVFRNTLILILTTAGLQFGSLMGQTVVVEKLFSWPGLGSLLVDSIFQRDIPVTQGCTLVMIFVFLIVNLVVDLLYSVIDPRIRY
ncbi:ABC transporter permease subunit [candidate division KSB3 bacterium]|uniref:Glutathione transport system permease protein GsiC n=1 Tax=candidate division KSB3 bacterium TaxID=2044937 RepID=A0A9D5Q550_9BACT|nr:ABC transporter permease subunit [candidate division KSB3 bacterium]MBD3323892.1 ABC transporter permease subunit [candidate division KSB3 bacterium]